MITVLVYRFLDSYFRHRWLYLIPILIMIIAAGVFFKVSKPKYIARGSIYVQTESFLAELNSVTPSDSSWWATPAQVVVSDMNELLRTDAFIRAVIFQTDLEDKMDEGAAVVGETITDVRDSIWITAVGENQILINAANENNKIAYQITNSFLDNFIQWQVNAQRVEGKAAEEFFAGLISEYESKLFKAREFLKDYLIANPPPLRGDRNEIIQMEIDRLRGEIDIAYSRYMSALEKEENARLALAQIDGDTRQSFTVIDAPLLPMKPEISRREMALQLGVFLAAGVILSCVAIVGSMLLDRTFRFPIDVYYGTQLQVLAIIPDTEVRYTLIQRLKRRLFKRKKINPAVNQEEISSEDERTSSEPGDKTKFFRSRHFKKRSKTAVAKDAEITNEGVIDRPSSSDGEEPEISEEEESIDNEVEPSLTQDTDSVSNGKKKNSPPYDAQSDDFLYFGTNGGYNKGDVIGEEMAHKTDDAS